MARRTTRRSRIRAASFAAAVLVVLGVSAVRGNLEAAQLRRELEAASLRSIGELSEMMTGVSNTLEKAICAGTPNQLALLSARLWRDAGAAKTALSALPGAEGELTEIYRLLSQAGDFAMSLSAQVSAGAVLTEQELGSLDGMLKYARALGEEVYNLEAQARAGQLLLSGADASQEGRSTLGGALEQAAELEGYATLIYDGPFSDHMLTLSPRALEDEREVTTAQAQQQARRASGAEDLRLAGKEDSLMPCYCFEGENVSVGITLRGGYPAYLTNGRAVGEAAVEPKRAVELAKAWLTTLGITGMHPAYYQCSEGVCTVNLAFSQDGVTCYPDLIKVGVALDNGEIVSADLRGYLSNHHARTFEQPAVTPEEGAAALGTVVSQVRYVGRAVIPTGGAGERDCYEYSAVGRNGRKLLLYVDVMTGQEAEILLLVETPNGVLTI